MANKSLISCVCLTIATIAVGACSGGKPINREEAQSDIRSAASYAAESETFIDFVLQGRATDPYAVGHAASLYDQTQRLSKELENSTTEPEAAESVRECRKQLDAILSELSGVRAAIHDHDRLADAKPKIEAVRKRLESLR